MLEILITGANRGLGYALTKEYVRKPDSRLFVVLRNPSVPSTVSQLQAEFKQRIIPIVVDLGHDECISVLRNKVSEHTDRLDIVINNAGIPSKIPDFSINSISTENILNLFNIHTLGAVRVIKSSIDLLKNAPQPKIINISSRLGSISKNANGDFEGGYSYAYRIAKAAQNMFTASLSHELKTLEYVRQLFIQGVFSQN